MELRDRSGRLIAPGGNRFKRREMRLSWLRNVFAAQLPASCAQQVRLTPLKRRFERVLVETGLGLGTISSLWGNWRRWAD
jgi:hypothetical protein